MRILKLERRGCNYFSHDKKNYAESDFDNYRYFARLGDKDGNSYCMEFQNHYHLVMKNGWCKKSDVYSFIEYQRTDKEGCSWAMNDDYSHFPGAKMEDVIASINRFCKKYGLEEVVSIELVDRL